MIARLSVVIPFTLCIPSGAQFKVFEYEVCGYKTRLFPPASSAQSANMNHPVKIEIAGKDSIYTDVIKIEFVRESFNRQTTLSFDPPIELMKKVLDSYIAKLRRITNGATALPLEFPGGTWFLQYFNDDGSDLPHEDGKARGKGMSHISSSAIGLTEEAWDAMLALPSDYIPPAWETLLLDASHPAIPPGSAIVLAATALEVFISYVLDSLASAQTSPAGLWMWVNDRNDYQKEPSVEEQYDKLLLIYCGHSLKEEKRLWETFKHLKKIRNIFVHTGVLNMEISGAPYTVATLVSAAEQIIEKVSQWLPTNLRWTKCRSDIRMRYGQRLFPF